jgi:hypothetical protein
MMTNSEALIYNANKQSAEIQELGKYKSGKYVFGKNKNFGKKILKEGCLCSAPSQRGDSPYATPKQKKSLYGL